MKKVLAVLFAVMFAFSVCTVAFAAYDEGGTATYKCQYCGSTFDNAASLADHAAATFPVEGHKVTCSNHCDVDFDGEDDCCDFETEYVAEMDRHQSVCEFKDGDSNWDKAVGYFKSVFGGNTGVIGDAFKYLGKAIVDFVKSDTFSSIIDTVKNLLGKIDLGSVVSTVKGVAEKIPFDSIVSKVKEVVA